ncbi:AAA family ATPase [Rhizobium sp. 16-449-1b]|uniref:ATP-dependent nuclease n=1 Tax=Rhizobium sp. 16-449-1b TaxID=2819989 RepID=UPI001ADB7E84|nr:ATP-binding protein [Rhizobium sp. 16-449-1b]MBO9195955.1 AAA family ATPase [Rhizobium sp. 16-449-1b]
MAVVRKIEIRNFRSIKSLDWWPTDGVNCLIGAGDSGKSSVLDAIDYCLGARRSLTINDSDFHNLEVENDISITVILGRLDDSLKNYEAYGDFLSGLRGSDGGIEDEPGHGLETVLRLNLTIAGDLEPRWRLLSKRAEDRGLDRGLNWGDRLALSPTRLGDWAEHNLAWRRGSVLNRLSDEKPDASKALSNAARDARKTFGTEAEKQLGEALAIVNRAARELGVPIGAAAKALLDTHSVSVSGGTIALHNEIGVPLRALGLGSTRLLIAGLQREVVGTTSILLVDEIEHGLEPHRIMRLIGSLGAKTQPAPQQVFATSHSPIVLRELSCNQLFVLRKTATGAHHPYSVPADTQGTLRAFPEAFLAPSVLLCEGATEVGFIRGFDQFCVAHRRISLQAAGVAVVDCGGGHADRPYQRAKALIGLGYRAAIFRDDDVKPSPAAQSEVVALGGLTFTWDEGQDIETAIVFNVDDAALLQMIDYAISVHGIDLIAAHVSTASQGAETLDNLRAVLHSQQHSASALQRNILARACGGKNAWFKSVGHMEYVARHILAPNFAGATEPFKAKVNQLLIWAQNVHG